ncbi:ATP-dependent helicase [uncultured Metabacillus sp.]|uniref:ATP-dependent helicase n=1 Tax=uncultured Metabacillus sp. TaxID=2860135 RepID=UPI002621A5C4|nr:ATP-dependent helicase [uncultured Metabacillus sp.]
MNNEIQSEFNRLTLIQKQAVDWDKGPLVVIAGPGSGKTKVLTLRIARLLEQSMEESYRILGLTFTNKAADEMRARIKELVTDVDNRLFLGTFHSFCAEVLRNHGSHVGVNPDFTIYSDTKDLNEILTEVKSRLEKDNIIEPIGVTNLLPIIQYLQRNLLEPNQSLNTLIKNTNLRNAVEHIYVDYWEKLKELNALDFDSLIFKTYMLFKKFPFIAKHYRTIYPYISIDEFQDTNFAQYQMIKQLTKDKHNNLFIVADDDQLIYQWNGASHKRLQEFKEDYGADLIQLTDNFRCPSIVVEVANNLIKHNKGRLNSKEPIRATKDVEENSDVLRLESFYTFEDEVEWIVNDIKERKAANQEGTSYSVIARSNKLLNAVYEKLKSNEVPVVISKRKNEFESPLLYWMHSLLRLANKRNDTRYLNEVVSSFEFFTKFHIDIEEIIAWSDSRDGDYLKGFYNCITPFDIEKQFLETFRLDLVEGKSFIDFIEQSMNWLEKRIDNTDEELKLLYDEEREVWNQFMGNFYYKYGNTPVTLSTFLQELDLSSKQKEPDLSYVQCLTIHSAKGKEFNHVYLLGLVEDELPSYMSKKKGNNSLEIEEERRGCFVAITRTVETLTLTFSERYNGWSKEPSRFLKEMGVLK